MKNSQIFQEFLFLLEKYGQADVYQKKIHVEGQDCDFLALIRVLFGRMLVSWNIVKDPDQPSKIFQSFFPDMLPKEINESFLRYQFGWSSKKNTEDRLLYPEIFCELYETYLDVKRHSTGSFYTPDFITEFMSHECLDRIFRDNSRERLFDLGISICDPACGTGRFLVAVASYLEELILPNWNPSKKTLEVDTSFSITPNFKRGLRQFILEHCIYGVEKDPIAAEICRLRLLAWFLELMPEREDILNIKLPDLSHIKVGNSLIGLSALSDAEKGRLGENPRAILDGRLLEMYSSQGIKISQSELNDIKPFHWSLEFGNRFTLLIGNPPYGNILSQVEKNILRKKDLAVNEVYINFLLRILWDEIPFQYASFLTPKSYLIRQNYLDFRQTLFSRACPYSINEIGSKMFKGALNEVQVLSFHRDPMYSSQLIIGSIGTTPTMIFDLRGESTTIPPIDNLNVCRNAKCTGLHGSAQFELYTLNKKCPACEEPAIPLNRIRLKITPQIHPLIERIEKAGNLNYLNPRDFPDLKRGEEDQGLKRVKAVLKPYDPKLCAFITAKNDFSPFYILPQKSFNLTQVQTQKNPRFYAPGPKLLIKHNSIVPETVFTREAYSFTAAIYSLLHPDEKTLKYLCGLLNSTLMQFYCIFGINNQNLVTMNLNQYMIRHLPIVSPASAGPTYDAIVGFIDKILEETVKFGDKLDKKPPLELQDLNQAIYSLYGISALDSIDLIDKSVQESMHYFSKRRPKIFL